MGSTNSIDCRQVLVRDHPHIHGEHEALEGHLLKDEGSPPYTWGAHTTLAADVTAKRITPIYMGSMTFQTTKNLPLKDHPHIHGEHIFADKTWDYAQGSPPYTWGALTDPKLDSLDFWITPIYMGSTTSRHLLTRARWDHPHIHGEHLSKLPVQSGSQGSPPYTWGALKA